MKKNNGKKFVRICFHLLFWIVVTYFMVNNSILRPHTQSLLKECVKVFLSMGCSYLSYFVLVPKFFIRQNKTYFILSSIGLVLLCGLLEMAVIYTSLYSSMFSTFKDMDPTGRMWKNYVLTVYGAISARFAGFALFFDVLQLFLIKEANIQKQSELVVQKLDTLFIGKDPKRIDVVPLKDIIHITYNNRYVSVVCANGKEYKEFSSLTSFIDKLPEKQFVRANRNTIISLSHLTSYSHTTAIIQNGSDLLNIPISESYHTFETLQRIVPALYQEI